MNTNTLAAHILRTLAHAQQRRRPMTLASLVEALGVRKVDVRAVVSRLHAQGFLDATTMRLTLVGFTVGASLRGVGLAKLRRPTRSKLVRAA
ncbi:MAG: hypothetical protein IT374_10310 [Polyangiaceae bacterium]|nr:hypothetical protein [Polyangiaceae bacterium]